MGRISRRTLLTVLVLSFAVVTLGWLLYQIESVREFAVDKARYFGPMAVPYLRNAFEDDHETVRWAAIRGLSARSMRGAGIPDLIQILGDSRVEMRIVAAGNIRVLGEEAKTAVPALIVLLGDPDSRARKAAADAFYFSGAAGRPAIPALVGCLSDNDPAVRMAAIGSLCRLPGEEEAPEVIAALSESLLHDREAKVRAWAARCLTCLGPETMPVLKQALEDPVYEVQRQATRALESLRRVQDRSRPH